MSRLLKLNLERSASSNMPSEGTERSRAPKKTARDDLQTDLFQEPIRPLPKPTNIEATSSSAQSGIPKVLSARTDGHWADCDVYPD